MDTDNVVRLSVQQKTELLDELLKKIDALGGSLGDVLTMGEALLFGVLKVGVSQGTPDTSDRKRVIAAIRDYMIQHIVVLAAQLMREGETTESPQQGTH